MAVATNGYVRDIESDGRSVPLITVQDEGEEKAEWKDIMRRYAITAFISIPVWIAMVTHA